MKRRIFVALPISEKLQKEILKWEKGYEHLPVRWLAGENLHITLVPPWEEEDLVWVKDKLQAVAHNTGPLEFEFQTITFGPTAREPRLIWASGEHAPPVLSQLKRSLEVVLGRTPERRPFLLHLTLARFRPENFHNFPNRNLDELVDWRDPVTELVLMESHLKNSGADYEVLHVVAL